MLLYRCDQPVSWADIAGGFDMHDGGAAIHHNGSGTCREPARDRIRRAARVVVARRGFDATIEEIAEEAGLSQRTVFRQCSSRDALIVEAVKDMFEACGERPIPGLPKPGEDLDGWITGLARTVHTRNAEIIGQAFWHIHSPHASAPLREICELRERYRIKGIRHLVELAWTAAGGQGAPPDSLTWVFALQFSAFTTQALTIDFGLSPMEIGDVTAELLTCALRRAIEEPGAERRFTDRLPAAGEPAEPTVSPVIATAAPTRPVPAGMQVVSPPI